MDNHSHLTKIGIFVVCGAVLSERVVGFGYTLILTQNRL